MKRTGKTLLSAAGQRFLVELLVETQWQAAKVHVLLKYALEALDEIAAGRRIDGLSVSDSAAWVADEIRKLQPKHEPLGVPFPPEPAAHRAQPEERSE